MPAPKRSGRSSSGANGGASGAGGRRPTKRTTSRSKASKKQQQQQQPAAIEQPEIPLAAPTTAEEAQRGAGGGNGNGMEMSEANAIYQNLPGFLAKGGDRVGGGNLMDGANPNANAIINDNPAPGGGGGGMSKHTYDDGDATSANKRPKRVSEGSDATAATLTDPASNVTSTNTNGNDPTACPPADIGGSGDNNFVCGDDFHGGTENGTTHLPTDANDNHNSTAEGGGEDDDEDPDWNAIMKHEPARADVPVFLNSRDKFDAAKEKFSNSLENYNASLHDCTQGLINVPIDVYTQEDEKVRAMEENLKQGFIRNAEKRESIEENLKKSAEAAQGLFANLMMRMSSTVTRDGAAGGQGN